MRVWTLVKKWDKYEDQNWIVMGVFETFDKAVNASDADLKEHPPYSPHEWELEDSTHRRDFDYSGYYNSGSNNEYYGYYEITEMEVQ